MKKLLLLISLFFISLIGFSQNSSIGVFYLHHTTTLNYNFNIGNWITEKSEDIDIKGFIDVDKNVIKIYDSVQTTLNLVNAVNTEEITDPDGNKLAYTVYEAFNQNGEDLNVKLKIWHELDYIQIYIVYGIDKAIAYDGLVEY